MESIRKRGPAAFSCCKRKGKLDIKAKTTWAVKGVVQFPPKESGGDGTGRTQGRPEIVTKEPCCKAIRAIEGLS
jgi:hypothetical protein